MTALALALAIVAGIAAVVELVRSRGASLTAWGLLALVIAFALPPLAAM